MAYGKDCRCGILADPGHCFELIAAGRETSVFGHPGREVAEAPRPLLGESERPEEVFKLPNRRRGER